MAARYFRNDDGQYIRRDGDYMRDEECCCCDIAAEFSSEGGDGRYVVNFFDESTSSCAITAWSWDFGDGGTSSSQDPTHEFADAGPHTVTLTVTDDCGCDDTVTHTISFTTSGCCGACAGPCIKSVNVTYDLSGRVYDCTAPTPDFDCDVYSGTYDLTSRASSGCGSCNFRRVASFPTTCGGGAESCYIDLNFANDGGGNIYVSHRIDPADGFGGTVAGATATAIPVTSPCYDLAGVVTDLTGFGICGSLLGGPPWGTVTINYLVPCVTQS